MTTDEIKVAVAKLRGWRRSPEHDYQKQGYGGFYTVETYTNEAAITDLIGLPHYPNDANECVKLCESMRDSQWFPKITPLCANQWDVSAMFGASHHRATGTFCGAVCEVYLKVNGKWRE